MADTQERSAGKKTENWLSMITLFGAAGGAAEGVSVWVALGILVLVTAVHAVCHTGLAADKPGVTTKAFWASIVVVIASVAAAIAEAEIPGVPPKLAQGAALIAAALTSAGYTVWRYKEKTKEVE